MDRPARNKKAVDYSDFMNDDDEDFASVKAPPNKKARASCKEPTKDPAASGRGCKERVLLDERKYNRDLEAALVLSLLNPTEHMEDTPTINPENRTGPEDSPPVLMHFSEESNCTDKASSPPPQDAPPVLSNCSVNASGLGLDQITSDQSSQSPVGSKRTSQKPTKSKRRGSDEDDDEEEYKPQATPESDSEFSDADQSEDEDEDYSMKKSAERSKSKTEKKPAVKIVKKEKTPAKTPKNKQPTVKKSVLNQSPAVTRPVSALKRPPTTPPTTKSPALSSPGGRLPKWTPPGVIGRSPGSCPSPSARSPGLGLRLGLSRLARVKPLHPNSVAH